VIDCKTLKLLSRLSNHGTMIMVKNPVQQSKIRCRPQERKYVVDSESILRTEFDAVFCFLKLAPVFSQSVRLVAAACRDAHFTFVFHYSPTLVTRRDKPRQLNVQIARKREPISRNRKQRRIQCLKYFQNQLFPFLRSTTNLILLRCAIIIFLIIRVRRSETAIS